MSRHARMSARQLRGARDSLADDGRSRSTRNSSSVDRATMSASAERASARSFIWASTRRSSATSRNAARNSRCEVLSASGPAPSKSSAATALQKSEWTRSTNGGGADAVPAGAAAVPPQPTSHIARKMDKTDNIRRRSASTTGTSEARDSLVLVRRRELSHVVGIKVWRRATHPCQRGTCGGLSLNDLIGPPQQRRWGHEVKGLPDDLGRLVVRSNALDG